MIRIEKNDIITDNFINWLIAQIKNEILAKVDIRQLNRLDKDTREIFGISVNVATAFLSIVDNIRFYEHSGYYIIDVDHNKKTNNIPLKELYQYITFGDMQVNGYPIILETLNNVISDLNKYQLRYNLVGVI